MVKFTMTYQLDLEPEKNICNKCKKLKKEANKFSNTYKEYICTCKR
jgi:hypothetical protein